MGFEAMPMTHVIRISVVFLVVAMNAGASPINTPTCSIAEAANGSVVKFNDGMYDRCISVVKPSTVKSTMPILFWFHGAFGNAQNCGSGELGQLVEQHGFALVCGEALQDAAVDLFGHKGQWMIPEIQTDETG